MIFLAGGDYSIVEFFSQVLPSASLGIEHFAEVHGRLSSSGDTLRLLDTIDLLSP